MQHENSFEISQNFPSSNKPIHIKPIVTVYDAPKATVDNLKTEVKPIDFEKRVIPVFPAEPEFTSNTNRKKEDFIELRNFLPATAEKMVSSRYESPLTQLKMSTKRWKMFTFLLGVFSFTYFLLNLWATLTLSKDEKLPKVFKQVSDIVIQMQDMQFYSFTMNIVMDIWALVIYSILFIMLLKENSNKLENIMNEKGLLEKTIIQLLTFVVILFGLSYIFGTVFMIYKTHNQVNAGLTSLITFHSSKMVYLLLNVIALRKYKSNKFIYEDLLLEALGPSDSGDDRSEIEENEQNYTNYVIPSLSIV